MNKSIMSMARRFLFGGLAAFASCLSGGEAAAEARSLFPDDLTFYCDFSDGLTARMANGSAAPFKVEGEPAFLPGRLAGNALLLGAGSAMPSYEAAGNIDLLAPGTLSFWLKPVNWRLPQDHDERGYLFIFRLIRAYSPERAASIVVGRMGFRKDGNRKDRMFAMANNFPEMKGTSVVSAVDSRDWRTDPWHLAVITWQPGRLLISIDGEPARAIRLPRDFTADDMPADKNKLWFMLGSNSPETTLIDEFAIYRRALTDAEIKKLWQRGAPAATSAAGHP